VGGGRGGRTKDWTEARQSERYEREFMHAWFVITCLYFTQVGADLERATQGARSDRGQHKKYIGSRVEVFICNEVLLKHEAPQHLAIVYLISSWNKLDFHHQVKRYGAKFSAAVTSNLLAHRKRYSVMLDDGTRLVFKFIYEWDFLLSRG
jgi:hypothetical protein